MIKLPSLVTILAQLQYLRNHLEDIENYSNFLNVFHINNSKICIQKSKQKSIDNIEDKLLYKKRNIIRSSEDI